MAFCPSCGAPVEGAFCTKCGAPVTGTGGQGFKTGQSVPPDYQPPASASAQKKHGALFWILIGCAVFIVVAGLAVIGTGIFVAKKAGLDPALMKQNPALAVAKMMANLNPDIEVLSVDEGSGTIRVREKRTGKTMSMSLKDAQRGKFVFQDEQGKVEIQAQGEGENAAVEVRSPEGTMKMGAAADPKLPAWLPAYPGAKAAGIFSFNGEDGKAGSCAFKSSDSAEKVSSFYENAMKSAGFSVQKSITRIPNQGSVIVLVGSDEAAQRNANVNVATSAEGTTISLAFENK
jgi:hypothetical protein